MLQDGAEGQNGGYNVITENTVGVQCENGSNAVLGLVTQSEEGGQNSIYNNTQYDVALYNGCYVYAHNKWWGQPSGPDLNKIIEVDSKLYYDPWLSSDPNGGSAPLEGGATPSTDARQLDAEPMSAGVRAISRAIAERLRGNHPTAVALLRSIVASPEESLYVKSWALTELLSNTPRFRTNGNSNYLRNLQNQQLQTTVRATLPPTYVEEQNGVQAGAEWDQNIRSTNSNLKCAGLYGRFLLALHQDGSIGDASALCNRLRTEHRGAAQTKLAERQLRLALGISNNTPAIVQGKERNESVSATASIAKRTAFALHPNYPNPFNPATTINYDLPEPSRVSLVVYDVLGRKIIELENGVKEEGYHSALWNAADVSSGVYFARFIATDVNGNVRLNKVSKLLLAK